MINFIIHFKNGDPFGFWSILLGIGTSTLLIMLMAIDEAKRDGHKLKNEEILAGIYVFFLCNWMILVGVGVLFLWGVEGPESPPELKNFPHDLFLFAVGGAILLFFTPLIGAIIWCIKNPQEKQKTRATQDSG